MSRSLLLALLASAVLAPMGCRDEAPPRPPVAEFLVAAGDSTFWIRSRENGVQVRGAPLQLARVDGRFQELYVVDDDRSYFEAVMIGQRIYARDLITNDSMMVFGDTIVPAIAQRYAERHPDDVPLAPDEDASDRPALIATVELELLPVYGPHLSYEMHADLERARGEEIRLLRRGVVDLRTGRPGDLRALFGDTAATRLLRAGRASFEAALDSVLAAEGDEAARAARTIDAFAFEPGSFSLVDLNADPAVLFVAPGRAEAGGFALPLEPIAAPRLPWWTALSAQLPRGDSETVHWKRPGFAVVARYDGAEERVALVIRDSLAREWPAGRLPAPVTQIFWLDSADADSTTRRALSLAFDQAALYSGEARSAARERRFERGTPRVLLASNSRPRRPARPVRRHPTHTATR